MKHIGILAHSAEGSALCYLTACHEGAKRLGAHQHPDITLSIIAMGESMPLWQNDDLGSIRKILAKSVERLKQAGCDFFICPDNTAHLALEFEGPDLPIPGLHIAEAVTQEALAKGFLQVGVLGTKWTMEGSVYLDALGRAGLHFQVPEAEDRGFVDRAIFDELCNGVFNEKTRSEFVRIISDMGANGCDCVVLGCTEIPLLITPLDSPLPVLDSTRLLATAAVAVALGHAALPMWHGGAVRS